MPLQRRLKVGLIIRAAGNLHEFCKEANDQITTYSFWDREW